MSMLSQGSCESGETEVGEHISSTQLKKRRKYERVRAIKLVKKQEARDKKRQEISERRADLRNKLDNMSEEERAVWVARRQDVRQERRQEAQEKKAKLQQALQNGQRVVIDLDFEGLMTESELKSLCQQLVYCWSSNCRAVNPCHIILSSFCGSVARQLQIQASGFDQWALTKHEGDLSTLPETQKLVYLTADAEEELTNVEEDSVYVIGGLVDRNRHKSICYDRAKKLVSQALASSGNAVQLIHGIRAAKLPIRQHLQLSGTAVLAVNHVFSIMLEYKQSGCWAEAVRKCIPGRKNKTGSLAGSCQPSSVAAGCVQSLETAGKIKEKLEAPERLEASDTVQSSGS